MLNQSICIEKLYQLFTRLTNLTIQKLDTRKK
jgi:hypothetical protein